MPTIEPVLSASQVLAVQKSVHSVHVADALLDYAQALIAQTRARAFREVRTRFAGCDQALLDEAKQRFGVETPFGGPTSSGMITLHCPPQHVHALASLLRERGAENVAVADLGYVFARANPLYAKLEAGLGPLPS